jgi:hypothetical protein
LLVLRKIFFYIFTAIYVVACPLTILYALGYLYSPGAETGLVRTGLIYLSTAPQGAAVYLGARRIAKKTPVVLRNLMPGDYSVRLQLHGFKSWSETLPVEAEKATALERILLLPQELKRKVLWDEAWETITPFQGGALFFLARGPRVEDHFIYDFKDDQIRPLLQYLPHLKGGRVSGVDSVRDSPFCLVRISFAEKEKYVWMEPRDPKVIPEDITSLFMETPEQVQWDPKDKNRIFTFRQNYLHRLDLASNSVYPRVVEGVRGFALHNRLLYVLTENSTVVRYDYEARIKEPLLDDAELAKSLFGEGRFFQLRIFPRQILIFLSDRGALLGSRLPYRYASEGIEGMQYDASHERLLVWKKGELGVIDFTKALWSDEIFEKGPRVLWVYRRGVRIEQAFWVYEGSHILFRDRDGVYLLELETYGKPHLHFLLEVKSKSSVFYSEATGKLYYLDPQSARLCSVEILPRKELVPFPFPERKEEKKKSEIREL